MPHSVNERLIFSSRFDHYFRCIGHFAQSIFVGEREDSGLLKLSFEGYVEVHKFIFQYVW